MQAFRQVSSRKDLPPTIDREWLDSLASILERRGARVELADDLGISPSQVTKLAKGERAPWELVMRVSRHLGIPLPRRWLGDREHRAVTLVRQLERLAADAPDESRRLAAQHMLDALLGDLESAQESMSDLMRARLRREARRDPERDN